MIFFLLHIYIYIIVCHIVIVGTPFFPIFLLKPKNPCRKKKLEREAILPAKRKLHRVGLGFRIVGLGGSVGFCSRFVGAQEPPAPGREEPPPNCWIRARTMPDEEPPKASSYSSVAHAACRADPSSCASLFWVPGVYHLPALQNSSERESARARFTRNYPERGV